MYMLPVSVRPCASGSRRMDFRWYIPFRIMDVDQLSKPKQDQPNEANQCFASDSFYLPYFFYF